jgi:hypothetical protein
MLRGTTFEADIRAVLVSIKRNNRLLNIIYASVQQCMYIMVDTSIKYVFRSFELSSNGNASETKANESFDNGVFFDIEAKRTPSIVSKLFSKRSEHIR